MNKKKVLITICLIILIVAVLYFAFSMIKKNSGEKDTVGGTFSLKIDGVYYTRNGVTVTGEVASGTIRVGDKIEMTVNTGKKKRSIVKRLEIYRKPVELATTGDNIGIVLDGIDKDEVVVGEIIKIVK